MKGRIYTLEDLCETIRENYNKGIIIGRSLLYPHDLPLECKLPAGYIPTGIINMSLRLERNFCEQFENWREEVKSSPVIRDLATIRSFAPYRNPLNVERYSGFIVGKTNLKKGIIDCWDLLPIVKIGQYGELGFIHRGRLIEPPRCLSLFSIPLFRDRSPEIQHFLKSMNQLFITFSNKETSKLKDIKGKIVGILYNHPPPNTYPLLLSDEVDITENFSYVYGERGCLFFASVVPSGIDEIRAFVVLPDSLFRSRLPIVDYVKNRAELLSEEVLLELLEETGVDGGVLRELREYLSPSEQEMLDSILSPLQQYLAGSSRSDRSTARCTRITAEALKGLEELMDLKELIDPPKSFEERMRCLRMLEICGEISIALLIRIMKGLAEEGKISRKGYEDTIKDVWKFFPEYCPGGEKFFDRRIFRPLQIKQVEIRG